MKRVRFRKKDGELIGKHNIRTAFESLKDGEYAMELKVWSGEKTWEQIKAVKGILIPRISDYTGETRDDVENRLKFDYGQWDYTTVRGEKCVRLKSFSQYSKRLMHDFITSSLEHAEHDCGIIFDLEERKQFHIDNETGELTEI